ncbi:MAG: glycosyltransferase, partial [Bacilli bacterium]|nr:glycosyltransferase [Bacilli bacterium]
AFSKNADLTITMDVDLQDDINVVRDMLLENQKGFDVVYGVRNDRSTDSFFKKATANGYYRMMRKLGVQMIENAADFRLISNRALAALLEYHEANLFLRGLVPQVGFPSSKVEYKRLERKQGKTHYPLSKMLMLAFDGMTAFSSKPLSFVGKLGFCLIILSVIAMVTFGILNGVNVLAFSIYYYLFPFISLMTGLILVCLGLMGLYLGKMNIEVKKRPHYFIETIEGE